MSYRPSASSSTPPTRANLLSFFLADQNPPFPHDQFWSNWEWFVKPLLSTYARHGARLINGGNPLPPLWPGDMFAAHRLQTRRLFDKLADSNQSQTTDPSVYLSRIDQAYGAAVREAMHRTFGEHATNSTAGTTARPWAKQIASLIDPLSFPLESVVYAKQQTIADALEIIEQNTNQLEVYRRERIEANAKLYDEINRLRGALYVLQRLDTNLDRVLSSEKRQ
jgi:hypothetical protein